MQLFFSGFFLSLSLCLDLGVVNLMILRAGIQSGFVNAFLIGIGSTLGDLLYALLSGLSIALLLKFYGVRLFLWLFGTVMLSYLSYRMFRESIHPKTLNATKTYIEKNKITTFMIGIGLALSSPSAILSGCAVKLRRLGLRYKALTLQGSI